MEEPALFVPDGDGYVATMLTQGGWDPRSANGGAALSLLGHCLEDIPTLVPMSVSRLTADLVHPVPIGRRLTVGHRILREGKKIQVVGMSLLADEVEQVRVTALRLREADFTGMDDLPVESTDERPADQLPPPEEAMAMTGTGRLKPPGFLQAVDMRRSDRLDGGGHGWWLRLHAPVIAGQPVRATARLAMWIDFANLINVAGHGAFTMINPDVTAHILRPPADGWVAVTGDTRFEFATGRGVSSAILSDEHGPWGFASTSQLVQPRP